MLLGQRHINVLSFEVRVNQGIKWRAKLDSHIVRSSQIIGPLRLGWIERNGGCGRIDPLGLRHNVAALTHWVYATTSITLDPTEHYGANACLGV